MDEFTDMIADIGLVDDSFGAREISALYNLSIMTQVNEIDKERHLKMFFDEFIDGLGRIAFKTCISSPYEKVKSIFKK